MFTIDEFIERSRKVHGNKYEYHKVVYQGQRVKVLITCTKHGDFLQVPRSHWKGTGCIECFNDRNKYSLSNFIEKASKIHDNKYTYGNFIEPINKRGKRKIEVFCRIHGKFTKSLTAHIDQKQECPYCAEIKRQKGFEKRKLTTEIFISRSSEIHNNEYDYSKTQYTNSRCPVLIRCTKHGEFSQCPIHHMNGVGCLICNSSKGEKRIRIILTRKNIDFESQYSFSNCRSSKNRLLKFDFFLPNFNICIEYDGEQHFKDVPFFKNSLQTIQNNDLIKNKYCKENNIPLVRIPYWDYKNITDILDGITEEKNE